MTSTLLWADGDDRFTSIGQRFMQRSGFEVVTTADALTCLHQLRASIPDVLVLDHELLWGGLDGILMWLREEVPLGEQPIVVLTGDDWPETMSAKTGVAAARCLRKPYRLPTILDAVATESEPPDACEDGESVLERVSWASKP